MPSIESIAKLRPFAYHFTAAANADLIRRTGKLHSARYWLDDARIRNDRSKRQHSMRVTAHGEQVVLRDQAPLFENNIAFANNWSFQDLIDTLNRHVYFWPGDDNGPIKAGRNFLSRYASEPLVALRIPTRNLLSSNAARLRVCRYNSGAPRCSGGKKSPRGTDTFLPLNPFDGTAGSVLEFVFEDFVELPEGVKPTPVRA